MERPATGIVGIEGDRDVAVGRHHHRIAPRAVEPLIAERFFFTCDIGSPLAELRARWPDVGFDHLRDPWWPQLEETEEAIVHRSETFRRQIAKDVWSDIAVVSHWGFHNEHTGVRR